MYTEVQVQCDYKEREEEMFNLLAEMRSRKQLWEDYKVVNKRGILGIKRIFLFKLKFILKFKLLRNKFGS